jgi:hypothetical protein
LDKSGVGKDTLVTLLQGGEKDIILDGIKLEAVRKRWEEEGRPRIPENIQKEMQDVISGGEKI